MWIILQYTGPDWKLIFVYGVRAVVGNSLYNRRNVHYHHWYGMFRGPTCCCVHPTSNVADFSLGLRIIYSFLRLLDTVHIDPSSQVMWYGWSHDGMGFSVLHTFISFVPVSPSLLSIPLPSTMGYWSFIHLLVVSDPLTDCLSCQWQDWLIANFITKQRSFQLSNLISAEWHWI